MPAYTVAQGAAECRRHMNSLDEATALEYFQLEHNELAAWLPINVTTEDVSVVSGTGEYTLNALTRRVWRVMWMTSETEGKRLNATSVPWLNANQPNWEYRAAATPSKRYVWLSGESTVLGLYPKPNVDTSGGYPIARLTVSRSSTLTLLSSFPANLLSYDCYVFGALLRHARANMVADRIKYYTEAKANAFQTEIQASMAAGFGDVEDAPSIDQSWLRIGGAV
jgi:hypothetical protein